MIDLKQIHRAGQSLGTLEETVLIVQWDDTIYYQHLGLIIDTGDLHVHVCMIMHSYNEHADTV